MTDTVFAVVTATLILITAVVGLVAKLTHDVQQVHVLVNSRMRDALVRIRQLHQALVDAGIDVPEHVRDDE